MMLRVLYEDESCFIVNKPSDLLVHHSHYARNIEEESLVDLLKAQGFETPVPVHRLDRKTSGVILFVKDKSYARTFQELFDKKEVTKKYHALLRGHVASEGEITTPVKNERGNYKEAHTRFRCLEQYELAIPVVPYPVSRYSLVEMVPLTGRMHQLRIHANKISHPIIGDPKYGNRHHNHMFAGELGIPHLFLHAAELSFIHPVSGKALILTAGKPDFWEKFLSDPRLSDHTANEPFNQA